MLNDFRICAIEGVKVAAPSLADFVVPITAVILLGLAIIFEGNAFRRVLVESGMENRVAPKRSRKGMRLARLRVDCRDADLHLRNHRPRQTGPYLRG